VRRTHWVIERLRDFESTLEATATGSKGWGRTRKTAKAGREDDCATEVALRAHINLSCAAGSAMGSGRRSPHPWPRFYFQLTASRAIAQTVISLSRTMKIAVIAEGVETREQRVLLEKLGCRCFQGFLFSPPLPSRSSSCSCGDLPRFP